MLKPFAIAGSALAYFLIAFVAGSTLNRYDHVFCDALKNRPARFQSTMFGFSSTAVVRYSIVPPDAGMRPMPLLRNENSFFMADPNAMRKPSGDHTGPASAPSCVTSFRTLPSATVTIEMSAVDPLVLALLMR